MRVSRQWRLLRSLQRSGFGHEEEEPGKGELATVCPACPQPEINLPPGWENDDNKYVHHYIAHFFYRC